MEEARASLAAQLAALQAELATLRGDREADAAEYERRLQEAVDSAEKWKQFAEGVQAKVGELEQQYGAVQAELQVGWGSPGSTGSTGSSSI